MIHLPIKGVYTFWYYPITKLLNYNPHERQKSEQNNELKLIDTQLSIQNGLYSKFTEMCRHMCLINNREHYSMGRQRAHIYEYDVIHAVLYDEYNTCGVHL